MGGLMRKILESKFVLTSIILGILISFATRLIPNESVVGVPEIKRYGHPLFWLITNLNEPSDYVITNLIIDIVLRVTISFISLFLIGKIITKLRITIAFKSSYYLSSYLFHSVYLWTLYMNWGMVFGEL